MSDKKPSQSQQFTDFFTQSMHDQVARTQAFYAEAEKLRLMAMERAQSNVDELARLTKESINYANQLATAWQNLAMESFRKAADVTAPGQG